MVRGSLTGMISSRPAITASAIGAQPAAWAPWMRGGRPRDATRPSLVELAPRLVDLGDQRAAGHRRHHVVGQSPAQLVGDLVGVGLRALGVVGAQVDVHEGPAVAIGRLGAQPVDVVVGALDGDDAGAVDLGGDDLGRLEVARHQDRGLEAERRRVGRHRVGQVAGRRAGDVVEAELDRHRDGQRHHPVLEGQARVADRVVLDPQLVDAELAGQARRRHQRRAAHGAPDRRLAAQRQELGVAPHVERTRGHAIAVDRAGDGVVVVVHLERAEAELAHVHRAVRHLRPALTAPESS